MIHPATARRTATFACVVALVVGFALAAPPAQPPPAKPPGGSIKIGGAEPVTPEQAKAKSEASESEAIAGTELAPGGVASASQPSTGPTTGPTTTQAATRPTTGPASLYLDVSFNRKASTRPAPQPKELPYGVISDYEIEQSIRQAIEVLADQFDPRTGHLRGRRYTPYYEPMECGLNALCAYALIQAGQAVNDPRLNDKSPAIKSLLEGLKRFRVDRGMHQTYARAMRAATLAVYNRDVDRNQLEEDVGCLAFGNVNGAYGYLSAVPESLSFNFDRKTPQGYPDWWADHSNSQYGLLGVWSGAEVGVPVHERYWQAALDEWVGSQAVNGMWGYGSAMKWPANAQRRPAPAVCTLSMTAAGTASLFVAGEYAERVDGGFKVGREPFPEPLKLALDWWEQGDHCVNLTKVKPEHLGYTLYGIERVGLASGFKFFGEHDWYRKLARQVVDKQKLNGSWGNLVETAYATLFLSRGRHPILMNKLRFDGRDRIQSDYWANRPNDTSYLARFASKQLERPLNWQIVPLTKDPADWLDAPILYIASHKRPSSFGKEQIEKLRRYVEHGGMIYTNADADADDPGGNPLERMARGGEVNEFDRYVPDLAAKLFPEYKFADVPSDHPIYTSLFQLKDKPKLKTISNGSRLLLVHSPKDMAIAWQRRDETKGRDAFEFGVNLFVYAAGKRDLRNRLDSPYVPPRTDKPATTAAGGQATVTVARLSYPGAWSPEPRAWERFANLLHWKTGTAIDVKTVPWKDLKPATATIAHVTGTTTYLPTPAERAATKSFVENGGILLVDDCGGSGAFARPIETTLSSTLPTAAKTDLTPTHPLLLGGEPGMADNLKLRLRPWSVERIATGKPPTVRAWRVGKGAVIFCPVDLTSGLLGLNTWGIHGYEPASAEGLVRNVVFWAMDGKQ